MPRRIALFALLLGLSAAPAALAWGEEGHRIVGHLAESGLTPAARAQIDRLLAGEAEPTLAGVSTWADQMREQPAWRHTASWHWVNLPRETPCTFEASRDCRPRQCIVGAIREQLGVLSDLRQPEPKRRDALKFVTHFVGDVHQPFHAGFADDRGGNLEQVRWQQRGWNLHALWDSAMVKQAGLAPADYARQLRGGPALPADATLANAVPEVEWALESCRLIREEALYPGRPQISGAYMEAKRPLAEQRLRQAGARLAALLNEALGAPALR